MAEKVLVTGGAGFIGSHVVDLLVERGYSVVIYDNLTPQVHGEAQHPPDYLNKDAELIIGDVRDREAVEKCLKDVDVVVHLAAAVGVGQSMYMVREYVDVNALGTATLLDVIVNNPRLRVRKIIVASSMSTYGEGKYECAKCGVVYPRLRPYEQLQRREWELYCPRCGKNSPPLSPLPTDEEKPQFPASVYAVTKRDQEEMVLSTCWSYKIPAVAMRFFNVFGHRQALSNPYTGVAAIFSTRLLNNKPPVIFEDGRQSRDFVHVSDVAQAVLLAIQRSEADFTALNVGTGRAVSILEIAKRLAEALGKQEIRPLFPQKFRAGDIRHCFADISRIKTLLGFEPKVDLTKGIEILADWARSQQPEDRLEQATSELEQHGLTF
ncbi:SDR family NAD(P)-dependent oxidoreductase [Candidatus Sumerlaeota bacterium]|nr:SDR family NAD(P)-dependent oxidoreductase [Candidatus Sumerlaeota bacterium]